MNLFVLLVVVFGLVWVVFLRKKRNDKPVHSDVIRIDLPDFLNKYKACIPVDLFMDLSERCFVKQEKNAMIPVSVYNKIMDSKAMEDKTADELSRVSGNNNLGIDYEKRGDVDMAIRVYEGNIAMDSPSMEFPARHSYDRLMVIYRRRKDYDNEIRIIRRALKIFARFDDDVERYSERLNKAIALKEKMKNE